jgi:hypothetical protein
LITISDELRMKNLETLPKDSERRGIALWTTI